MNRSTKLLAVGAVALFLFLLVTRDSTAPPKDTSSSDTRAEPNDEPAPPTKSSKKASEGKSSGLNTGVRIAFDSTERSVPVEVHTSLPSFSHLLPFSFGCY